MILITGATGFIGQQLTRDLLKANKSVRVLVRHPEEAKTLFPKADIVQGDVLVPESLDAALKSVSEVIHLAGVISYTLPKNELFRVNVEGTRNILAAAKTAQIKKFVFASSVSVYGSTQKQVTENDLPQPRNPYGESKLHAEEDVLASGLPSVCLRISVVYGAGSPIWNKILRFFGKGFPIPDAKTQTNLVHVSDVSRAFQLALTKGSGVYNIADRELPFKDLALLLARELGIKPKFWPPWLVKTLASVKGKGKDMDAFILNRQYDFSKAAQELGFEPRAPFETSVRAMVDAYKKDQRAF